MLRRFICWLRGAAPSCDLDSHLWIPTIWVEILPGGKMAYTDKCTRCNKTRKRVVQEH